MNKEKSKNKIVCTDEGFSTELEGTIEDMLQVLQNNIQCSFEAMKEVLRENTGLDETSIDIGCRASVLYAIADDEDKNDMIKKIEEAKTSKVFESEVLQ